MVLSWRAWGCAVGEFDNLCAVPGCVLPRALLSAAVAALCKDTTDDFTLAQDCLHLSNACYVSKDARRAAREKCVESLSTPIVPCTGRKLANILQQVSQVYMVSGSQCPQGLCINLEESACNQRTLGSYCTVSPMAQ
jgi:hypothetical protein